MSDIDDLRDLVESNQNYNVEAHVVLQTAIDNEREMRIAGDAASIAAVTTVTNSLQLTNQQLSQEVLDRSAGDLVSDNNITALTSRFISEWESINQDLTTLKVNTNNSLTLLDQSIDATNLAIGVQKTDLMEIIDYRFNYVSNKTTQLQADVDKYLVLLQDITMDSSQITMDNGEVNMGAWTILSQAREWDLEILRGFKNFTAETEQNINDALEDLQNKLPIEQDIIDKAIEALSNSQTIKDLDAAIKDNGIEIAQVNDALIAEAQRISNDIINLSQAKTNELKAEVGEVNSRVEKEVTDRIDAVQREVRIRQEQINQQTVDMNAEIDERVTELTTQVNDVLNNAVDGFNQQVTELKNQDAYILDDLTTYKTTNDDRVTGVVNQTTINTNNITQQASQLSAVQTTLGTKNRTFTQSSQPSSTGLVTGDTWINTTSGKNFEVKVWSGTAWVAVTDPRISANATNIANQSTQITNLQNGVTANTNSINALNIDVSNIKAESVTFAKAKAVEDLTANVSIIDGKVSNNTSKISTLESTAEQLQEDINSKATSAAFEALKSDVQITKDNVSSNSSKITQLDNSVSTIENKIPTLATNSALDATNSSIQVEKGRIDNTISRLNTVDTAIAGKANQSSVDTIANRVTATENENTAQGNRLTSVEGSVSSLNQTTGANSSAISGLTNDVSAINQDLNAKAQRFDRIESNIRGLSLDTTPNLNQRNKWAFISVKKPYPYMAQSIVPDYSYLNKFVAYASTYLNEDGTLPSAAEYENAIHYFRTALYVNETKTITLNYFQGDDAHAVYLNNELIRTETGVAASALTLNLKQGWNLLDVIVNNGGGPGGFSYGSALQSLVDVMAATRLVNVDQDANASATQALTTRVSSNEQAIATKAESSAVTNLAAQVNQNKADAAQTYVTKADNNQSEAALGNQLTAAYKAADSTVLNSAANDATTKANQAYNDSKAYVEQYAYGKANADQAVAGAIANYNAQLIIGANNLYEGTQNWTGPWENAYRYETLSEKFKDFTVKRTSLTWGGLAKSMVFDLNAEYTLSAWIRKSQADVAIVFWGNGVDGTDSIGYDKPIVPNTWVRVTHTFKGNGTLANGRFEKRENGSQGHYDICGLKLERGNKATDWSPNPNDAINGLVLGGRNLFNRNVVYQEFAGANVVAKYASGFDVWGVVENNAVLRLYNIAFPVGNSVISFDHFIGTGGFTLTFDVNEGTEVSFVAEQGWHKYEIVVNNTVQRSDGWLDINGLTGQPHQFRNFMVERGNKASDYKPAPEDVASDINKVQANLTNFQEAQANVDLAQTNRLNSAESQLGSNTARIVNVEQTYAKQDQVAALARTGLESEYKNYADNAVGNLQIGGENLLLNSDFSKSPLKMAYLGGEFNTVELTAALQYREASLSNQTYLTVSIWYTQLDSINVNKPFESLVLGRSSITADPWDVRLWTRDSSIKVVKEGSFYKLTGTVMIPANGVLFAANPKFILISGYGCNLYKVKVEKGTKSTDWSPNPLDITSVINWQIIDEPTDLNNMTATGKYLLKNITANSPMNAWAYLVVDAAQPDRILQTMWKDNDLTQKFERNKLNSTWRDWLKAVNNEEFNTYKSTVETIYQTKSDATSTTADLINRLTSKANQSGLDALSADVANNYYTKAQTDSVAAGVVNRYKAELGNIINYTVVSRGNEIGGVGYLQNAEGGWVVGGARSYTLVVFNGDGTVNWSRSYDIFGQGSPANQVLYDDINALPNGVYALIFTSDEPASGRDANLIFPALRMLGGTREVNDKLGYRGSYMLIGRKGMVEGTAVEMVAPSNQTITYGLQFVNGVPVGIGNTALAMPSQFASASAVQNIQAQVSSIDGRVTSQAYSITELRSDLDKVGSAGPNLVKNSDFSNQNLSNWDSTGGASVYVANDLNWEYALSSAGDSRYAVTQGGGEVEFFQFVPVEGNKIYQVAANVASHRSSVKIYVSWWGKDMSYLGYTGGNVADWSKNGDGASQAFGGSAGLPATKRIYQNNIAPPNAYYMKVTLGRSTGYDPYMWVTRVTAVEIASLATPVIPWGESSRGTGIKLTETAQAVDGVKAVSTVSVDNNGFISGYGLISQLVNGVVQSAFGVNADYFYVGTSNSNKKKPFMVLTSPQTINGVTYPAGTWIDVALIANATIGTAHIADAAITNAKIANLDASKITTGTLDANRIGANTITAEKLTIGDTTNLWGNQSFNTSGARPLSNRSQWRTDATNYLKGNGVQMWGRDHIAPYSTKIPLKPGDTFVIEYVGGQNSGPAKTLGVGLLVYDAFGSVGNSPWQYGNATIISDLGNGWYRWRRTFQVWDNGSGQPAAFGCLYFQIEQSESESNPTYWTVGDVTVRKAMGGELIVNGAITSDKLYSREVSGMFASFGTMTTYKNTNNPNGARMVMSGSLITVYDDNNVVRVKLGLW